MVQEELVRCVRGVIVVVVMMLVGQVTMRLDHARLK